jgi:hypothetical protein
MSDMSDSGLLKLPCGGTAIDQSEEAWHTTLLCDEVESENIAAEVLVADEEVFSNTNVQRPLTGEREGNLWDKHCIRYRLVG